MRLNILLTGWHKSQECVTCYSFRVRYKFDDTEFWAGEICWVEWWCWRLGFVSFLKGHTNLMLTNLFRFLSTNQIDSVYQWLFHIGLVCVHDRIHEPPIRIGHVSVCQATACKVGLLILKAYRAKVKVLIKGTVASCYVISSSKTYL